LSEEKNYDYSIELKGKPKLDVTQPDSETTAIIKEFKSFDINNENFKIFKAKLDIWYASKMASLNEQIYELAEQLKDFPEIDETNFQFEDRKKMTKQEKIELLAKLPIFTEEWRDKLSALMRIMSKAFTNSIFLIDILWESNKKMAVFLEGNSVAVATEIKPQLSNKILIPIEERRKLVAIEYMAGKAPSDIRDAHPEWNLPQTGVSKEAALGIVDMLGNKEVTMEQVKQKVPRLMGTIQGSLKNMKVEVTS